MLVEIIFPMFTFGLATYFAISVFRKYSVHRNWLDVPNQRSSHDQPVPRGAGLVIVPVCLIGYLTTVLVMRLHFSWGYFTGALVLAAVSWIDDLRSISFIWRLLTHCVVAFLVVYTEGAWNVISFGEGLSISLGWTAPVISVLWIVWIINTYNFMDGIDGIAAIQGLVACAAWALITIREQNGAYLYTLIVFSALSAFIMHNWYPAKVFIGDIGSAFLGFTFASLPLMIANESQVRSDLLPLASVLILWPFIFDTGLTLIRRALRREFLWHAHREHLYQLLVISGSRQPTVAMFYGLFAVVTSLAAYLLLMGTPNWIFPMVGLVLIVSIIFTLVVAKVYQNGSRTRSPHEAR